MGHERRSAVQSGLVRLCALLVLCFVLPGCHKQGPKPAPPVSQAPPPAAVDSPSTSDGDFREGRCVEAIAAYSKYLQANPGAPDRDRVLLRVAICRLLPHSATRDTDEGLRILNDLVARYPASPWRPYAELILALDAQARDRAAGLEQANATVRTVSEQLEAARKAESYTRGEIQQLQASNAKDLKEKDSRIRQLTATVEELEERIRKLSEELEALKKIDLQRRPTRPRP